MNKPPIYLVNNEVWDRGHCHLPFGIMFVGRALKDAGFPVRLFHLHRGEENLLYEAIKQEPPLFVGISTIIGSTLARDVALSRELKARGQTVVWGGVLASMLPEMTMQEGYVDFVVKGDAEITAPKLAEAILNKCPPKGIPGVCFKDGEQVLTNPGCEWPHDLDRFQPGWELIDFKQYVAGNLGPQGCSWPLFYSRGCPYSCGFCYNQIDGERKLWRCNSLDYWKQQIEYLDKNLPCKFGMAVVVGDNSFGNLKRAWEMIRELKRPWSGMARVELVNDDFVRRCEETRAASLGIGIESGSERMLKVYNKGVTTTQTLQAMERLGHIKCSVYSGIVLFGPGETLEERRMTVEFMEKARGVNPYLYFSINPYWAFPGTPLWEKVLALGFRPPSTLAEWSKRFIDFMEVHGWDRRKWARTYSVMRLLYSLPRASGELVPAFARKMLYRRLHNFQFNYPIEEVLRFAYRTYYLGRQRPL